MYHFEIFSFMRKKKFYLLNFSFCPPFWFQQYAKCLKQKQFKDRKQKWENTQGGKAKKKKKRKKVVYVGENKSRGENRIWNISSLIFFCDLIIGMW